MSTAIREWAVVDLVSVVYIPLADLSQTFLLRQCQSFSPNPVDCIAVDLPSRTELQRRL